MKGMLVGVLILAIQGCAQHPTASIQLAQNDCVGSTKIREGLSESFNLIEDPELLSQSLGEPLKGKLCQGAVYQSTQEVVVYRAWNSTNPHSQYGQWWSFDYPTGLSADYREDYEICYQWSPLDKLTQCTLKPGSKVVVGNGQSATCSDYLSYPVSETQQVFISSASDAVLNCVNFDSVMSWE